MRKYSAYFNKRSRLHRKPELEGPGPELLAPLDPDQLPETLSRLLQVQNDFFPCFDWTFPPPLLSKSSSPSTISELFSEPSVIPDRYSLYLHSPFCKSLCSFCYYTVMPGKGIAESATYVDYLVREMALYADRMKAAVCESIYFGGGTPTHLDDELLIKLFENMHRKFNIARDAEITIEAAPGTLAIEKVRLLKLLGVNRLSYGIQTLDEALLAGLNRHYSVNEAMVELEHALEIIGNVNIDTMYGFDNEPDDALEATLDKFHRMGIPSLSIYSLDKQRSEQKTEFLPPKDEQYERKIKQFSGATRFLNERGYQAVLQNVFIKPEQASYTHQLRRWDNLTLVALGIASQGYAPKTPYQNISTLKGYYRSIDADLLPIATVDHLSAEMELCRELTSKLRFTEVDGNELSEKYGVNIFSVFKDLVSALVGMDFLEQDGSILRMTEESSYYNNIIPMLFSPDAFKETLLELPEEYLETFPVPYILTQVGATQSTDIRLKREPYEALREDRRIQLDRRQEINPIISDRRYGEDRRFNQSRTGSGSAQSASLSEIISKI
ncbi:MAG: hypothetical protein BMS9Abin33_0077 [Gammaproteobacteria bacterium]|nr:MAG: hypothetical protein BMS9Abin33_0077 [Gammaproteobacteria bacterium]